jgi:hypothetical protein
MPALDVSEIMRTYHFELALGTPTTEQQDEHLFERFGGRVSSAIINGSGLLYAHLEAASMEHAIREAVEGVRALGLSIRRIELDPDTILADAA